MEVFQNSDDISAGYEFDLQMINLSSPDVFTLSFLAAIFYVCLKYKIMYSHLQSKIDLIIDLHCSNHLIYCLYAIFFS